MNNFPVTNSTISAKHLGLFIQEKYGLSPETGCKLFRTGINHSYIVSDHDKKFVFRIYSFNWRSELEILEEIRLLNLLKDHAISVSYPILDTSQNYIQNIPAPEGLRYGVLFSYAKGEKIRHLSKELSFNIGALMASMHRVTEKIALKRKIYDVNTLAVQPYQFAKEHFSESNAEMRFIKYACNIIDQVFGSADTDKIRTGAVHLDIWYDNMHINSLSDTTIFDFDFCGNSWLLHDIAYFIMHRTYAKEETT